MEYKTPLIESLDKVLYGETSSQNRQTCLPGSGIDNKCCAGSGSCPLIGGGGNNCQAGLGKSNACAEAGK